MSASSINQFAAKYSKHQVVNVKSGDTVKVSQKIREGNKERVQIFQGLVIRVYRSGSHTNRILVRRVASGIGVEKSFLLHSPLVTKVEVIKRSDVRRNYLSYMRELTGKSSRLSGVDFDKTSVNKIDEPVIETSKDEKDEVLETPKEEVPASVEEIPKDEIEK
jgi:large subunit ribosomal protein L19